MDRSYIDPAIKSILTEVHQRTIEASRVAKAADVCAQAGSVDEAISVSMDLDRIFYDAGRLHEAACLLKRLSGD
ncbi:hypothetical protein [Bradyrhizobium sp. G127]|jgi:hypothetical protein|uniref:hypothetical protein n=1 Tax=Bradyrhizobium sp. G127 TaxID=2904800 RepID=UPI001F471C6D|nr:hypothetical protein [Bradyrhizobium sp. G127]MCF2524928.1 hypothetical protein [Bradyrhizobium sp. G127]